MTVPDEEAFTDTDEAFDEYMEPIPVYVKKSHRQAAHFGSFASAAVPVAGAGLPVLVLNRRPTRNKAVIRNPVVAVPEAIEGSGVVTGPGAGQVIATVNVPQGTYLVTWIVGFASGATAAAEIDNFQLMQGAVVQEVSSNGNTTSTFYSQPNDLIVVPAAGSVVTVNAVAAGTGTAVYRASLVLTATGGNQPVILSDNSARLTGLAPSGFQLDSGYQIESESQEQLWAIVPVGGAPVTLSIRDEAWENINDSAANPE